MLSQFVEPEYAFALLEEGSARRAYSRVKDLEELTAPIHGVAAGGSAIDSKVVEALVAARSGQESSPLDSLTPRDRDALTEMARGKTSAGP